MRNSLANYTTRIYQFFFGFALLAFAMSVLRRTMASGSSHRLYTVGIMIVGIALILALDRYYWALACFLLFIVRIPGMKVSGLELGGAVLVALHFARTIVGKEQSQRFSFPLFPLLLPYLAWVAIMFILNPCGLYIFGSESIGFRFYSILAIGVLSFFILSRLSFSERDAHILFWVAMAGSFSYMILNAKILRGFFTGSAFTDNLHYEFLQMRIVAMLLLCRYPLAILLTNVRLFLCIAGSCLLCIYSGNRSTAVTPPVCAAILTFCRRKERGLFMVLATIGIVSMLFLALGHGHLYRLPQGVQKALSFLPGDWDNKWKEYGFHDEFREDLNRRAKAFIRNHPWTGRKGFAISLGEISWLIARDENMEGHTVSGNWHNLWLGLAADFGIPCSLFFALFYFASLAYAYRKIRIFQQGSWQETMYLFMFLRLALIFVNSLYNGGHSAKTPEETFLWLGFCLALINGRERELRMGTLLPSSLPVNSS